MKGLIILIVLSTFLYNTYSQTTPPSIQIQKSLGGNYDDGVYSIQQTSDNGFILCGYSDSNNGDVTGHHGTVGGTYLDCWIVKLDSALNIQWQKSLGGSSWEEAASIKQTPDKGYIVAARSYSSDGDLTGNKGNLDCWIIKLDSLGTIVWQKNFGGSMYERASGINITSDGGYIVVGTTSSSDGDVTTNKGYFDVWAYKLDSLGNLIWQKTYGGTGDEYAYSIQQTFDGGYILAGETDSPDGDIVGFHGWTDGWVIKIDSIGNIIWQKPLGGSDIDGMFSIQETPDKGFISTGYSCSVNGNATSNNGLSDYWIVKLDSLGSVKWQKSIGGSNWENATYIRTTNDGGYVVVGSSDSNDGDVSNSHGNTNEDIWAAKLDSIGNIQWEISLGGTSDDGGLPQQHSNEGGPTAIQTNDGGYFVAGYSYSNDGDVTGHHGVSGASGTTDVWVVKLNFSTDILNQLISQDIVVFPNPATSSITLKTNQINSTVKIYNLSGMLLKEVVLCGYMNTIDINDLSTGIYMIEVISDQNIYHTKIIKE